MRTFSFVISCFILLLVGIISSQYEDMRSGHPRGISSLESLLKGSLSVHKEDSCYELLTCEDKIILAQLAHELSELPKSSSSRVSLVFLDQQLKKLVSTDAQYIRIATALKASLIRESISTSSEDISSLSKKLQASQELNSYLQNYLASIKAFYRAIDKIKENPVQAYLLYSLADKTNWQAKLLSLVADIPDFDETPLGKSFDWVRSARGDLIHSFDDTLEKLELNWFDQERFSQKLRRELQHQFNQAEQAIVSADMAVMGSANVYKKSYQAVLGATIIAATWGTAGPLMFSLNGAGLYLSAESAIDLSESLIDTYGDGGSGDFYCSYARNNLENYELENIFISGAIGGGMAFVATGLISTMLRSSSKIVTVGGATLMAGGLLYGANAVIAAPAGEINKLQLHREEALDRNDYKMERCLALAQKKIGAGIAINTTALLLSLKGIGEAEFSTVKLSAPNGTLISSTKSIKKPKSTKGKPPRKIKVADEVRTQLSPKSIPKGKVTPRAVIKKLETDEVEWSMINLNIYLNQFGIKPSRLFEVPQFPGHKEGDFLSKMFLEARDRFSEPAFLLRHLKELLSEYEYFRLSELGDTAQPSDFPKSWREFIHHIGRLENIETEVLTKKFFTNKEFKEIIGKKLLFDGAFSNKSHGETTHALQILFLYRHFKSLKVPDSLIDDFFDSLGTVEMDIWGKLFDGFGENISSPETLNRIFKNLKFYNSANSGL